MENDSKLQERVKELEDECERLKKENAALMNCVEPSTDPKESSNTLFEMNLLLNRQIKEYNLHLITINDSLQHEIKERKKIEERLKLEMDFASTVLNTADVWVVIFDKDLNVVRINQTCEKAIGLISEETVGKNLREFFTDNNKADEICQSFCKVIGGKQTYHELHPWQLRDGTERYIAWSTAIIYDSSGNSEFIISCGLDITEYKQAENERLRIEHKYHNLLNFLPQTVYERDDKGYFTFLNNHGLKEFGLTTEDLNTGIHIMSLIDDNRKDRALEKLNNLSSTELFADEFIMKRKDGSLFPALIYSSYVSMGNEDSMRCGIVINISVLRETEKQLNEYRNHLEDLVKNRTEELSSTIIKLEDEMTGRKRVEQALRDSEKKYRELVQNANSIMLKVNANGVCTFFNEFGQSFFGFAEDEMLGKKVTETIVPPFDSSSGKPLKQLLREIFRYPDKYYYNENENIKKSGERVWIAWNNRPIYDKSSGQRQVLCIGNDISARKRAEEALKVSETKYKFLFEDSPAGSIIIGRDGLLKDVNKSFCSNLGYSRSDLIGKEAMHFVIPEQKSIISDRINCYFNQIQQPEMDVGMFAKSNNIHYTRFSGKASVIFENGEIFGILVTGVDVTQKKQIEELNRQQQQNLIQADKMATLGILISGVAHEINNPNNFILLNSNNISDVWRDVVPILDKKLKDNGDFSVAGLPYSEIRDDVPPLITGIAEGAERIRRIVQSLKDFARKDSGNLEDNVNINTIIETSILILNNLIKRSTHHFIVEYYQGTAEIRGNFQQIEQVIINLITNACQALTDPSQAIAVTIYINDKGKFTIEIRDEGRGIAPEHINHILDPFFTTKRDSGGTGLGLSISYNIVKDHHGDLQFTSQPGRGTTARVILPVFKQSQ
jgi:PAS domain S-box-containing protein